MSEQGPMVSIGMPVRNGQKYLKYAIDSLLGQTFGDLEVVVADNCSTDATEEICREFMRRDKRVKHFRNERDLGPAMNHRRCFEHSRGKYFRWHAYDDMCAPGYLEAVVPVLEKNPDVANAHCLTRMIDDTAQKVVDYDFRTATDSPSISTRFDSFINVSHREHWNYEVFGLMRHAQMAETPLQNAWPHGDRIFLVRMTLRGRFVEVPEYLFLARHHPGQSVRQMTTRATYLAFLGTGPRPPAEWWDASKKGKIVFPEWKLMYEYWKSIGEVPLSLGDDLRCRLAVAKWIARNPHKLGRDVAYAIEHVVTRRGAIQESPPCAEPQPMVARSSLQKSGT